MIEAIMAMNRELKRVPLDFDWELNKVWYGYLFSTCHSKAYDGEECKYCKKFAKIMGFKMGEYCPVFPFPEFHPPKGEGWQCWETTSEGSPMSPVFKTFEKLCEWLANNPKGITKNMTKEDWHKALKSKYPAIDLQTKKLVLPKSEGVGGSE